MSTLQLIVFAFLAGMFSGEMNKQTGSISFAIACFIFFGAIALYGGDK